MPMLKLTKTAIEKAVKQARDSYDPPAPGPKQDVLYWCTESKGFGLRVSPTGRATFIAQGRVKGTTKDVRITIGTFGAWDVDSARRRAEEHKHQCEDGIDTREVKKAERAKQADDELSSVTLQQVLDRYVGRPGQLKASTAAEYRRHVEKVLADWRHLPIANITRSMVQERHRELVEGGLAGKKAAPQSANAAFVTLRILCNFAMDEYVRSDGEPLMARSPVSALKRHWAPSGDRTERYIDMGKVGEVWNALQAARANPKNRDALSGIDLTIFALLVGARRDEMAALSWNRVVLDDEKPAKSRWNLVDRKQGKPIWLPLSSQAVALLKQRPRRIDEKGNESPYVFPSWGKQGRIMDARGAMETVSKVAGKHLSLHDMRRTFTNIAMRECLIEKFRVDLLTGHKPFDDDVTSRHYADLTNLGWLHADAQKVSDWIEAQGRAAKERHDAKTMRDAA